MKKKKKKTQRLDRRVDEQSIFDIDPNDLSRHWLLQSKYVIKYGIEMAEAKYQADRAKSIVNIALADARKEIIKNPNKFNLPNSQVATIAAAVDAHPSVRKAYKKHRLRKYQVDVIDAFLKALEHLKRALEKLVGIQAQGYYADPKADGELEKEYMKRTTRKSSRKRGQRKPKNKSQNS